MSASGRPIDEGSADSRGWKAFVVKLTFALLAAIAGLGALFEFWGPILRLLDGPIEPFRTKAVLAALSFVAAGATFLALMLQNPSRPSVFTKKHRRALALLFFGVALCAAILVVVGAMQEAPTDQLISPLHDIATNNSSGFRVCGNATGACQLK